MGEEYMLLKVKVLYYHHLRKQDACPPLAGIYRYVIKSMSYPHMLWYVVISTLFSAGEEGRYVMVAARNGPEPTSRTSTTSRPQSTCLGCRKLNTL